jgi:hypothetical protein
MIIYVTFEIKRCAAGGFLGPYRVNIKSKKHLS